MTDYNLLDPTLFSGSLVDIETDADGNEFALPITIAGSVGDPALITFMPDNNTGSGSGIFPSFLRMADSNTDPFNVPGSEQGFNTDNPNGTLNDKASPVLVHSVLLSDLGTVTINGVQYYEFHIDLAQAGNTPNITLDALKAYTSTSIAEMSDWDNAAQTLDPTKFLLGYDLGANTVEMTSASGNGHAEYTLDIPVSDFPDPSTGQFYFTLYAQFGLPGDYPTDGSFEEFSYLAKTPDGGGGGSEGIVAVKFADTTDVCHEGETITYTEFVQSSGGSGSLTITGVEDPLTGTPVMIYGVDGDPTQGDHLHNIGDINDNNLLDPGETWAFTSSYVVQLSDFTDNGNPDGGSGVIHNLVTFHATDNTGATFDAPADVDVKLDDPEISVVKKTIANTTAGDVEIVGGGDVLKGTNLTWTYDVTNTGNVDFTSGPDLTDLGSDNSTLTNALGGAITAVLNGDGFNVGDVDEDGIFGQGETWSYKATGVAIAGTYTNTVTATDDNFIDGLGNTCGAIDTDSSGYYGDSPAIHIDKVTTGKDLIGVSHTGDNIVIAVGNAVTWTYTVTNTGDIGLTNVYVTDSQGVTVTPATSGGYNVGDTHDLGVLDTDETWTFTASGTAVVGPYSNTGTAHGTATDSVQQSTTVTATDPSNYTGVKFIPSAGGLTIGYWYNHTLAQVKGAEPHHWASEVYVTGVGWGVLLGDYTGAYWQSHNTTGTALAQNAIPTGMLFVPDAAAFQLINSSQSANDTRQIFISQALGAQLNVNGGDKDPGYNGTFTGKDLMSEAVAWLTGKITYIDHTSGNVDLNGNGILDISGTTGTTNGSAHTKDYDTGTAKFTFEGPTESVAGVWHTADYDVANGSLTSSSNAWQTNQSYLADDYTRLLSAPWSQLQTVANTAFLADGEGLKNALQALNQNHLIVSSDGQYVAWNQSGSATGPYTDVSLNGPNDFWSILHIEVHNALNASSLHGIL